MSTYATPPTTFDELVAPFSREIREAATALRTLVLASIPEAREHVSGGLKFAMALYSIGATTNVACGLQPTAANVKYFLHHLRDGDVPGLKLEGSGKHARHVKITSAVQAKRPEIVHATNEAARGARAKGL